MKHHTPLLRREKLITARPPILLESGNGILIEIFEWKSKSAKLRAHGNPRVFDLWGKMEKCGRNVSLSRINEADDIFANLRIMRL